MRSDILLRAAILAKVRRFYRRFEKLAREVRAVQQRVLLEKIHRCRDSRFGRDHDFAGIRTVDDFRERLPVAGYDAFKPYI